MILTLLQDHYELRLRVKSKLLENSNINITTYNMNNVKIIYALT